MKQTVKEAALQELHSNYVITEEDGLGWHKRIMLDMFKKGAEWQARQSPWISVTDAIPNTDADGTCIVKFADGATEEMAMREVSKWIYPYINTGYVTHWRPMTSFDQILEANKDVLQRMKEKGK